ncbi:hypothetical protein WR25_04371 [Diploscapter pachys]|uniref:RRM domain-containing protein n=1 Tax=Diploscapter pachys TaxID=2018661 RepID=A0A2A2JH85_9BILA|nr:hypothetical protein WR25_04371 [Diploscapter pachys]
MSAEVGDSADLDEKRLDSSEKVANGSERKSRSRSRSRSRDKEKRRRSGSSSGRSRSRSRSKDRSRSKSRSRSRSRSRDRRRRSRSRSNTYSPQRDDRGRRVVNGRIHISDFGGDVRRRDLEKAFERFGKITDFWMASYPPYYAFITFKHDSDAEEAIRKMNEERVMGHRIRVAYALPRRESGGGGRYGGRHGGGGGGGGGGGRRDYG